MDERTAITIRFPSELLDGLRQALSAGESINSFIIQAGERELERRRAWKAHERISATRSRVQARTGTQPSSVELIRGLREGSSRS